MHSFHGADGRIPVAALIQAIDGDFYGTTDVGGAFDIGTIFEMDAAGTVTTLYSFDDTAGRNPRSGLVQASDGNFYGCTGGGGASGIGVVYRLDHQCFRDVPTSNLFYSYICMIGVHRITGGCGGGNYCPANNVTREQMAVFLLKAKNGPGFVPPPCSGLFGDVACPSDFADWIEELAAEGVTAGCGGPNYCPMSAVRRDQMAAFLLKAEHGSSYTPPVCTGVFGDVTCPSQFADWVEQLAAEGVTGGCGPSSYCPGNPNTRGQMAVFLTKTFHLQ